jgi:T-complex protein 1 subunit delta
MVIRDIDRDQVEFISKTIGCTPAASLEQFTKEKLGEAESV